MPIIYVRHSTVDPPLYAGQESVLAQPQAIATAIASSFTTRFTNNLYSPHPYPIMIPVNGAINYTSPFQVKPNQLNNTPGYPQPTLLRQIQIYQTQQNQGRTLGSP